MERAGLSESHLEHAVLADANLKGAYLISVHLEQAYLGGAHLEWANLTNSDVTQEQLDGACGDEHTKLPKGHPANPAGDAARAPAGRLRPLMAQVQTRPNLYHARAAGRRAQIQSKVTRMRGSGAAPLSGTGLDVLGPPAPRVGRRVVIRPALVDLLQSGRLVSEYPLDEVRLDKA